MSTKVIKYISVCLLVLAFGSFGAGVAKAALTANATALTSDGVLTITGSDVSVWSVASAAADDNLTVSVTGATASSLILSSAGTGANAMQITTSAGGLDISVTGTAAGEDLDIDTVGATTEMRLTSASTEDDALVLSASADTGGVHILAGDGEPLAVGTDESIELRATADTIVALSAAGSLVVDGSTVVSTNADGALDINVNTLTADVEAVNIALTLDNLAAGGAEATGLLITLTTNDIDGDMTGISIVTAATAVATVDGYEAAIKIDNAENTAGSMPDAIVITSSGVDAGITTALNVSAANIATALSFGANAIDGTYFDVAGTTGAVTLTQQAVGTSPLTFTGLDNGTAALLDINVSNVSGTLIDVDYVAETQTGDLTGLDLNLNTNVTAAADQDVTGVNVQTPVLTAADTAVTTTYTGYNISAAGALDVTEGANAAVLAWRGVNVTMPAIDTGTGDTTTATGILISAGTVTNGLGTENSVAVDATDADIVTALSIGANDIAGTTGTITFTDFTVGADGNVTILSDDAGDALTFTLAAADLQAIVINAATAVNASTDGLIDLNIATATDGFEGINMDLQVDDDAGIDTVMGVYVNVDNNATTADDVVYGVYVNNEDGVAATDALVYLNQADTDTAVVSGIFFNVAAGAITNAIDATDAQIATALIFGDNAIDGTYFDVAGTTGAVTLTQQAVGTSPLTFTGLDNGTAALLDINVSNVSGTLIDVDYVAETQTGDLTGLDLNLNTNVTSATDQDVTGVNVQTPALTVTDTSVTTTYTGYNISAAGTLSTTDGGVGAAVINWRGANITIPALTANTGDTVTGTGILVAAGTVTNGAGTETAIGIDVSDTDIVTALSIGANTILSDGTVTFNRAATGTVTLTATDDDANAALTVSSGGTGTLTLDGGGASAIVVGSADVTSLTAIVDNDVIIQNGATGNVTLELRDTADSAIDTRTHSIMTVNCTDAGDGTEDCDFTIGVMEAGAAAETRFNIDADAGVTIGSSNSTAVTLSTDGTGDAEVVLPASSVTAGEIADIARAVNIGIMEFADCDTDAGALISFASGADALPDFINSATDGLGFTLTFDDTGAQEDQGSSVCATLTVPPDYASGGEFRIRASKDAHAGNAETIDCYVSINGAALGAISSVTTSASASTSYTCTPAGTYAANDSVSFTFALAATTIDDTVNVASVEYVYTATE